LSVVGSASVRVSVLRSGAVSALVLASVVGPRSVSALVRGLTSV
jgi:hypothetical protein